MTLKEDSEPREIENLTASNDYTIAFQTLCSPCRSVEHHTGSCPTKEGVLASSSTDDDIFNLLLVMDGDEEPEQQELLRRLKISWKA